MMKARDEIYAELASASAKLKPGELLLIAEAVGHISDEHLKDHLRRLIRENSDPKTT